MEYVSKFHSDLPFFMRAALFTTLTAVSRVVEMALSLSQGNLQVSLITIPAMSSEGSFLVFN